MIKNLPTPVLFIMIKLYIIRSSAVNYVYKHPRKPIKTRRIKLFRTYFKCIFSLMCVYIILRWYMMLNVYINIYNILYKRIIYLYAHIL